MNLPKTYEPAEYESTIYDLWQASGAFKPISKLEQGSFSIVVPPPNANGNLHIGHALTLAIQDAIIRYQRMQGRAALLLPGADHAGFETQVVYERELAKSGKSRFDFSREELYDQIWDFVDQNKQNYQNQFRRIGASVEWDRFTFTLDDKIVDRAHKTFKKMWDDGLIYRGERLVNYCTHHGTAFADIEVEYETESGKMYHIRYPLVGMEEGKKKDRYIVIATTRPETMLGDVAVAVNPGDKRYVDLVGKTIKLPLSDREIPIVADDMVDMEFGTGAVKITPAHDPNDYDVATRHELPLVRVITEEGVVGYDAPEVYCGLLVEDAREQVSEELQQLGLLAKIEEYEHRVGHCYKCGSVIQPLVREQWFINMKPLAKKAIKALKAKQIKFYPDSKRLQLITYLEGLRDWNISRQIAWGIPIPAFQNVDNPSDWIFDTRVNQELLVRDGVTYRRDPDVFDTWFSSGQWPFATLDYPDGDDFDKFYPLSLMETGGDILAPWVSRMIMLGMYVTGKVPFKEVYLHGLILDEHGAKMSKSKGNVINPMDVIDEYGSDALRMGIITGQSAGHNQPFGVPKVVGARNFANKLWNIARFIEGVVGDKYQQGREVKPITVADHWMLTKLHQSSQKISKNMESYKLSEAYDTVYHTIWDELADWYIEASKAAPNLDLLAYSLEVVLKLAHPFAPFVTETIWQTLRWQGDTLLIASQWPDVKPGNSSRAADFEVIKAIVSEARAISRNLGLAKPILKYQDSSIVSENADLITRLARLEKVEPSTGASGLKLTTIEEDCWIEVDTDTARNYLTKLEEAQTAEALNVERLLARLANKSYVNNAPPELVAQTKEQLVESKAKLAQITAEIDAFSVQ